MNENKLQSLFNFLALMSEICGSVNVLKQSPDYIESKFIKYLNDFDVFSFPKINLSLSLEELDLLQEYANIWGVKNDDRLNNIIIFIYRVCWDRGVLPSNKLKMFKICIGDYNLIIEPNYKYDGMHEVLIREFFEKNIYNSRNERLINDLYILNRLFKIDSIINI